MSISVLLVEDDAAIRDMITFSLRQVGFTCEASKDAESGLEWLKNQQPDMILLDWMLPGIDGIEFIRRLRANEFLASIPVIMLTAKGESEDMVKGLSVGADDYINKPFSPPELIARIKAVLRRCRPMEDDDAQKLQMGELVMDTKSHRVSVNGERIELGPTEFRLLHFFMKNPERAYNRSQLLDFVWGDTVYIEERTVDVHIRRLRKALEPSGHDNLVQTVRGVGYRFSAE
ncbi:MULTISPECIES: phosphate regulon transcriptional regulator PhoB [unclassified Methylophaga]|jgi:two-component system phosphate regulon response regulator PhoB|uniref:phosphate regulon transcriptional regulator PhoB n=1 Tax=unclassified Methylophaga TaxID=2629249 RepID=UPI000C8C7F3A|nr:MULTISPECIES: phosphate regulon transcriptional regulator PhoB [unclassified Methylophaga]MAK66752.1 phosphate regulon transcriptional regulatory protein PhoB [Methylophaga sp.]MAY17680.1 phosphate regulon transcriptional regulatory protein PhoB [Methylophaga sp.]MBN47017.1 phosphate regulon transcriptional regulatory protein PhoB [Methylophaga sp.]HAO25986.1 phosphate regulon transcriptional regulatory protein PhoB [Methylophaga sp.]HCD06118.1 phosphate regulon transcriptional regulatory p|tara:strand:- start:46202 stop:46894 length:693 start_codon:yes stop_codon:yes gene_type:complete